MAIAPRPDRAMGPPAARTRRRAAWAFALGLALVLGATRPAAAQVGDGVAVRLTGPAVPYAEVEHLLRDRHGTGVAGVTKRFTGRFGYFDRMGLVALDELPAYLDRWFPPGSPALKPPRPGPEARAVLTVTWWRGGREQSFAVALPPPPGGLAAAALAQDIQRAIEGIGGAVPYQDALLKADEAGRVHLRTHPRARVVIDGLRLPEPTPVEAWVLPVGTYKVTFEPLDGSAPREYPLKVTVGQATVLDVDLR